MSITINKEFVPSSDGIHALSGKVYIPEENPKGLFHVVHGMTEHIERYDFFMRKLAEDGYICFGYDLMGHSMGSFVSRLAAEKYIKPDKFIIMGTGGPNPSAGIGLIAIDIAKIFKGEKYISKTIDNLAFGSFNSHFEDENDTIAWLTKDKEQKEKYAADPFCTFKFTLSAMHDLVTLNKKANRAAWFRSIKMPVLIVSGSDDPVGDYGKGVTKVYEKLKKAGCDVQIKLYENCRHEILNDTCRDEVVRDIENFIA